MKLLNIKDALKLYGILAQHLPEADDSTIILDYVDEIVKSIVESNQHRSYLDAVSLMSGIPIEELLDKPIPDVIEMFVDGLVTNNVPLLKQFCEELGV